VAVKLMPKQRAGIDWSGAPFEHDPFLGDQRLFRITLQGGGYMTSPPVKKFRPFFQARRQDADWRGAGNRG